MFASITPVSHARLDIQRLTRLRAFTLVELLVVIGIIALLVSVLLPALNTARNSAKTIQCAANMRTLGQGMVSFANEHGGNRMPAGGQFASPSWAATNFYEIINLTFFRQTGDRFKRTGNYWVNGPLQPRTFGCPSIEIGELKGQAFAINSYVAGGTDPSFVFRIQHPNPAYIHSDFANPGASDPTRQLGRVDLGAKLNKFKRTSDKILVVERERTSGTVRENAPNPVIRGTENYTPWSANGGSYTFRHARRTRMNALFLDGHVGSFHYRDTDFNVKAKFIYDY